MNFLIISILFSYASWEWMQVYYSFARLCLHMILGWICVSDMHNLSLSACVAVDFGFWQLNTYYPNESCIFVRLSYSGWPLTFLTLALNQHFQQNAHRSVGMLLKIYIIWSCDFGFSDTWSGLPTRRITWFWGEGIMSTSRIEVLFFKGTSEGLFIFLADFYEFMLKNAKFPCFKLYIALGNFKLQGRLGESKPFFCVERLICFNESLTLCCCLHWKFKAKR